MGWLPDTLFKKLRRNRGEILKKLKMFRILTANLLNQRKIHVFGKARTTVSSKSNEFDKLPQKNALKSETLNR